jgi:GT2 family glycosyltransferase
VLKYDATVIIASKNRFLHAKSLLESLDSQITKFNLQIILIDDGSNEEYRSLVSRRWIFEVVRNNVSTGPGRARNQGSQLAEAEILIFTDDDCRPNPHWIESIISALHSGKYSAVTGPIKVQSDKQLIFRYLRSSLALSPLETSFSKPRTNVQRLRSYFKFFVGATTADKTARFVYATGTANLSVLRKVFREINGFDPRYEFSGEDHDLCRRIFALGGQGIWFSPDIEVDHVYDAKISDSIRRVLAYSRGNELMRNKFPDKGIIIFPLPLLSLASVIFIPYANHQLIFTIIFGSPLCYIRYLKQCFLEKRIEPIVYGYIQYFFEGLSNIEVVRFNLLRLINRFKS